MCGKIKTPFERLKATIATNTTLNEEQTDIQADLKRLKKTMTETLTIPRL